MAPLDDAEQYFGKPGEIIVCGISGARTYPRMENNSYSFRQQTPESPRAIEPRYSSPPSSQRSSGYGSVASSYQQSSLSRYEAPQQYANYTNQAAYGQSSAASSVSSRQYPAKAQGFYESSANSRYY